MYSTGKTILPVATTAGAAALLPNTGSNSVVTVAVSVAVGLLTWGVIYSRQAK